MTAAAVRQVLVSLSLAHVTLEDHLRLRELVVPVVDDKVGPVSSHWWLEARQTPFSATPIRTGWLIRIFSDDPLSHDYDDAFATFSAAFQAVLLWAIEQKAAWLLLDADMEPGDQFAVQGIRNLPCPTQAEA